MEITFHTSGAAWTLVVNGVAFDVPLDAAQQVTAQLNTVAEQLKSARWALQTRAFEVKAARPDFYPTWPVSQGLTILVRDGYLARPGHAPHGRRVDPSAISLRLRLAAAPGRHVHLRPLHAGDQGAGRQAAAQPEGGPQGVQGCSPRPALQRTAAMNWQVTRRLEYEQHRYQVRGLGSCLGDHRPGAQR